MGLVYFACNDFTAAGKCFDSGLLIDPNHKGLRAHQLLVNRDKQNTEVKLNII